MRVVITCSHRFARTGDGAVWSPEVSYAFWQRYLAVFDKVLLVGRVRDVDTVPERWREVTGPSVEVHPVPYYIGPRQYLMKYRQVRRSVEAVLRPGDALIFRGDGPVETPVLNQAMREGRPYGVEVIGDPYDVFAPGAFAHPLRPVFRRRAVRDAQEQCRHAACVSYVSTLRLPTRYPAPAEAFVTNYSSIDLRPEAFAGAPRSAFSPDGRTRLVTVASLAQRYKGVDVLIDTVGQLTARGLDTCLTVVGDGRHREELEAQAEGLGLTERVRFAGHLPPGEDVRRELDQADLFVLASRAEGLPRAMIEAMARGLPCVGTSVGGIPELIGAGEIVPPNDATALAATLAEVIADEGRMREMAARNIVVVEEYRADVLQARRTHLYSRLRAATEAWQWNASR